MNTPPLIVFSDLDGTLLDHETYSWAAARPALRRLAALGVPVILSSSKTAAEITVLQKAMELEGLPAIVENGAGVIGVDQGDGDADDYDKVRAALDTLPDALSGAFTGFGDLTDAGVAEVTGLSPEDAARARKRQFSEPGLWRGTDAARRLFVEALAKRAIHAREGGRFLTLSFGRSKADGMRRVIDHFGTERTLALGDAPNDIEMLETAEHGIIIANPHHEALPLLEGEARGRITRTTLAGPAGWNRAVQKLLDQLDLRGRRTHG